MVVLSRCLGQEACRYNAQMVRDDFVREIEPFVSFVATCPELEIGLGVPRDPIRLVRIGPQAGGRGSPVNPPPRLVQPSTGRDLTEAMSGFATRFLDGLADVDGFILKNRSPSCGIKDVKIYAEAGNSPSVGTGPGLFAAAVLDRFGHLAIEDEGRLRNPRIRHHFLTRLFTLARFREVRSAIGGAVAGVETAGPQLRATETPGSPGRGVTGAAAREMAGSQGIGGAGVGETAGSPGRGVAGAGTRETGSQGIGGAGDGEMAGSQGRAVNVAGAAVRAGRRASIARLVEFHAAHKLMFMAHSQAILRELGRIVANADGRPAREVVDRYGEGLGRLLARPARPASWVNVAQHAFGYFSSELTAREREFFSDLLADYRAERQPLQSVLSVLAGWVVRFRTTYLEAQVLFSPYPAELLELEHR